MSQKLHSLHYYVGDMSAITTKAWFHATPNEWCHNQFKKFKKKKNIFLKKSLTIQRSVGMTIGRDERSLGVPQCGLYRTKNAMRRTIFKQMWQESASSTISTPPSLSKYFYRCNLDNSYTIIEFIHNNWLMTFIQLSKHIIGCTRIMIE